MSASFTFEGLEELRAELRNLPAELTGEAGHLVEAATNAAEVDVKAEYSKHVLTGDLIGHVSSKVETEGFGVVGTVTSGSKLAWIFENGTAARHYVTVKGKQHLLGAMPAAHAFVPALQRNRKRLYEGLADLVHRHGLEVTIDGAA